LKCSKERKRDRNQLLRLDEIDPRDTIDPRDPKLDETDPRDTRPIDTDPPDDRKILTNDSGTRLEVDRIQISNVTNLRFRLRFPHTATRFRHRFRLPSRVRPPYAEIRTRFRVLKHLAVFPFFQKKTSTSSTRS